MSKRATDRLSKFLRWLCALGGWVLFAFEWVRISRQTAHQDEVILISLLISSLIIVHVSTYFWIGHNKKVASKGQRGSSTRYISPQFSHDHLGKAVFLDDEVRQSKEIIISIEGERKRYSSPESALSTSRGYGFARLGEKEGGS